MKIITCFGEKSNCGTLILIGFLCFFLLVIVFHILSLCFNGLKDDGTLLQLPQSLGFSRPQNKIASTFCH